MNNDDAPAQHLVMDKVQIENVTFPRRTHHSGDILVVDDETAIIELIAETLAEEGYKVRTAQDGASALFEILAYPPALIILDIGMPVMTGDELLRRLRQDSFFSDLPIIVLTAGLHPERMLDQGATTVLAKPFDLDALVAYVNHYSALPPGQADRMLH